eukprot:jgi/Botrbrau1/23343/Bobra.0051s0003.1
MNSLWSMRRKLNVICLCAAALFGNASFSHQSKTAHPPSAQAPLAHESAHQQAHAVAGMASENPFVEGLPSINITMTIQEQCVWGGWTFLDDAGPPSMVPDPIFTWYGGSITALYWWRAKDAPCGSFDWLSYTLAAKFNGFEGPEPRYRTTQSWSSNPKCCGSGTYFVYACEVAVFKWTDHGDGRQDVSLYDPSDTKTPFLTIKGIWFSTPSLGITLPPPRTGSPASAAGASRMSRRRRTGQKTASRSRLATA